MNTDNTLDHLFAERLPDLSSASRALARASVLAEDARQAFLAARRIAAQVDESNLIDEEKETLRETHGIAALAALVLEPISLAHEMESSEALQDEIALVQRDAE